MKYEKKIITLEPKALLRLSEILKEAIGKAHPEIKFKFTKYRRSREYTIIKNKILKITEVSISEPTLCDILTNQHNGKMSNHIYTSLTKFIDYVLSYSEEPSPQSVLWGPDYGKQPGIFINSISGKFIPWDKLKQELESQVLQGCPRVIPIDGRVEVLSFHKKKNHLVRIFDNSANVVGDIWLGGDPENGFLRDGYIRIGKAISETKWIVYQIYQRFSDNSYRLIKSNI